MHLPGTESLVLGTVGSEDQLLLEQHLLTAMMILDVTNNEPTLARARVLRASLVW